MNYRHIYHAGNFADVFKHIIISRILTYQQRKSQAIRIIDTHAGIGLYDLSSIEAQKTGEWHEGVGRIFGQPLDAAIKGLLTPWLDAVASYNQNGNFKFYPGSPCLVRYLMRKQDRLSALELHPYDYRLLKKRFAGDWQSRILHLDGWLALGAHLPPKEKRGLVLVDPPFEQAGEFERLVSGLIKAHKRFATGTYALWYPVKDYQQLKYFFQALTQSGIKNILRLELRRNAPSSLPQLDGSGMIIVNPPYILREEIAQLSPFLLSTLCQPDGEIINEMLVGEN